MQARSLGYFVTIAATMAEAARENLPRVVAAKSTAQYATT